VTFPLLADFHPKAKMTVDYGLWFEDWGTSRRAIIILDEEGIVRHAEVFKKGLPEIEAMLATVAEIAAN
jgi:alkyl hydroperoxide reductase subunit AhpC